MSRSTPKKYVSRQTDATEQGLERIGLSDGD